MLWLILYVYLTGLRDVQTAGKALFLGVPGRMFLEEISICFGRLNKETALTRVDGLCPFVKGPNTTKRLQKGEFFLSFLELGRPSSPAVNIRAPRSQAFRLGGICTFPVLSGSLACRWQAVRLLSLHNQMNQFL